MQYIIQHTFATKNPIYLLNNFINYYLFYSKATDRIFLGSGRLNNQLFQKDGFNGTEISMILSGILNNDFSINKRIIQSFKKYSNIIQAVHANTAKSTIDKRHKSNTFLNFWMDNDKTRYAIENTIYLSSELIYKKPFIIFHPGRYTTENKDIVYKSLIKNLKFAETVAKKQKTIIFLENDVQKDDKENIIGADIELLKNAMNEIDSEYIRICYDLGHANVQARYSWQTGEISEEQLSNFYYHKKFITELNKFIGYAHIHYNCAHIADNNIVLKNNNLFPSHTNIEDSHSPISKADKKSLQSIKEVLNLLKNKTSIKEYGKIHLELTNTKLFSIIPFNKFGADIEDALDSLKIVKDIFE